MESQLSLSSYALAGSPDWEVSVAQIQELIELAAFLVDPKMI